MMNMESARKYIGNAVESLSKILPLEGLKSQALNIIGIVRERLDIIIEKFNSLSPVEIIKNQIMEAHHPYALLLNASPMLMGPNGGIDASGMSSISSLSASVQGSSGSNEIAPINSIKNISSAAFLGLSSSAHSPQASLISTGLALSGMGTERDGRMVRSAEPLLGGLSSILGLAAGSEPAIGNLVQQSFAVGDMRATEAMVMPLMMMSKDKSVELKNPIEVKPNRIQCGSVVANVFVYNGSKPYIVEGDGLDGPQVVRTGDKFLALHVNQNGADNQYGKLEPIARAKAIKRDFQGLCNLLDHPKEYGLSEEQVASVEALSRAPIIGVSHLVRLIAAKGLPTWNIDVLPKMLRAFHRVDSQLVSKQFGGSRKVKTADIGVMFLPAEMRKMVN